MPPTTRVDLEQLEKKVADILAMSGEATMSMTVKHFQILIMELKESREKLAQLELLPSAKNILLPSPSKEGMKEGE